jgi:hypothetical protein
MPEVSQRVRMPSDCQRNAFSGCHMACTWFAQALSATQGGGGGWRLVWLGAASNTLLWLWTHRPCCSEESSSSRCCFSCCKDMKTFCSVDSTALCCALASSARCCISRASASRTCDSLTTRTRNAQPSRVRTNEKSNICAQTTPPRSSDALPRIIHTSGGQQRPGECRCPCVGRCDHAYLLALL